MTDLKSSTCSTASCSSRTTPGRLGQDGHRRTAGGKQIDYHEDSDQWVPRGDVLRCIIDDAGQNGEVTIHIDDKELSLAEFGRLLRVHAGWGCGLRSCLGIHSRESKGRGPKAQAPEALTREQAQAVSAATRLQV